MLGEKNANQSQVTILGARGSVPVSGALLSPILYDGEAELICYALDLEKLYQAVGQMMKKPLWPVGTEAYWAKITYKELGTSPCRIEDSPVTVSWLPVSHPDGALAFRADWGEHSMVYATDCELDEPGGKKLEEFARDTQLFILDAQYTKTEYDMYRGYGHSSVEDAAVVIAGSGAKQEGTISRNYYANGLNKKLAADLNELSASTDVSVEFQENAEVNSDVTLGTGTGTLKLNMGVSSLTVKSAALTLTDHVSVSGSGDKLISMEGGKLVLGISGSTDSSGLRLENTGSGYVIAITNEQQSNTGVVVCNDQDLVMISKNGAGYTIQGIAWDKDKNTVNMPNYVTVQNGSLQWRNDVYSLTYAQEEFDEGTLTAEEVNQALKDNARVIIGEKARMVVEENGTVTVPEGKVLDIRSEVVQEAEDKFSGASDLPKGATLRLETGSSLVIHGCLWGNGTIQVGNSGKGANLILTSTGSLWADDIQLASGSHITNEGTIDGGQITSSGGAAIVNNSLIKLKYAYTSTGTDAYNGSADSVLISGEESTAMPKEPENKGSLLARIDTVSGGSITTKSYQHYYADVLNQQAAKYMNQYIADNSGSGSCICEFNKDALVPMGTSIELKNLNAELGTYEIQTAGDLKLTDAEVIKGSGESVIRVKQGGTLTFNRSSVSTADTSVIQNTSEGKNVIAADDSVSSSGKPYVTWNDKNLSFQAENASSIDNVIKGLQMEQNEVVYESILKLTDGWKPVWDAGSSRLKLDGSTL